MAVSGSGSSGESAVTLVSPAVSKAPPQPATEPDTSSANSKPLSAENGKIKEEEEEEEEGFQVNFSLPILVIKFSSICNCVVASPIKSNIFSFSLVTIHVSHSCSCGPYFDPRKVKAMPGQFGPGQILTVMREIFQTFLMAALNPRQMLNLLKRGEGEIITLTLESKPMTVRIPVFMEVEDFYTYIRRQLEDLCACEHLLSKRKETCSKCIVTTLQSARIAKDEILTLGEKRRWSSDNQQNPTTTTSTLTSQLKQESPQSIASPVPQTMSVSPSPSKQPRKSVPGKKLIPLQLLYLLCTYIISLKTNKLQAL